MCGRPHKFHLKENAVSFAAHTPIPIPHHWRDEVKRQLEKDIEMGIFQRAPIGKSTEWCMRMVTVSKVDGTEGGGNSQWKLGIHVYAPLLVTGKIKKKMSWL